VRLVVRGVFARIRPKSCSNPTQVLLESDPSLARARVKSLRRGWFLLTAELVKRVLIVPHTDVHALRVALGYLHATRHVRLGTTLVVIHFSMESSFYQLKNHLADQWNVLKDLVRYASLPISPPRFCRPVDSPYIVYALNRICSTSMFKR
jgi:hypothetical protein